MPFATPPAASRRDLLLAIAAATLLPAVMPLDASAQDLPATPACGDDDEPTPAQTAGPYFTPGSPEKRDFRADVSAGEGVTLVGFVMTRRCQPVGRALVDLWHADASGAYDNGGYRLRGHQFTDAQGRFIVATIRPGLYPGRTRHYHVRVQPAGGRILTTQLYFADEPANRRDGLFRRELLLKPAQPGVMRFDFVVG